MYEEGADGRSSLEPKVTKVTKEQRAARREQVKAVAVSASTQ